MIPFISPLQIVICNIIKMSSSSNISKHGLCPLYHNYKFPFAIQTIPWNKFFFQDFQWQYTLALETNWVLLSRYKNMCYTPYITINIIEIIYSSKISKHMLYPLYHHLQYNRNDFFFQDIKTCVIPLISPFAI
jgi:hypothetical protein